MAETTIPDSGEGSGDYDVFNKLPHHKRHMVWAMFTAGLKDLSTDPTGHLPECGYTDAKPECGCAEFGVKLHKALTNAVAGLDI